MALAPATALHLTEALAATGVLLGSLFHLGCAVVMGLNCFVWAFVALYSAITYVVLGG